MFAKFELKENDVPIFKLIRSVSYAALDKIDTELDHLEKKWENYRRLSIVIGSLQRFTEKRDQKKIVYV